MTMFDALSGINPLFRSPPPVLLQWQPAPPLPCTS